MLRFGRYLLDIEGRRLLCDGKLAPLEPQAFDVLVYLALNQQRVVPKGEILDSVWGDRWVSEAALTTRIKEIRRALGDSGTLQESIRTVRRRGYQFVAAPTPQEVEEPAESAVVVGRHRDLAEIESRLAPGALVSVVGPGGVGKTTVARALASRVGSRYPDGCLLIDLSVIRDSGELMNVIAHAAQVFNPKPGTLAKVLRSLDALLVLDDADELTTPVAELCSILHRECSRLVTVVTSRERLGVTHEQIWPLLPLNERDAVELLRVRARALAPLGSLIAADHGQLRSLTLLVDALPLAIEMLASASAYLDLGDLTDIVTAHPELLTDPRRDSPVRHQTLEVLVSHSISHLDDRLHPALLATAMFAGPFRPIDAAAVASGPQGIRDVQALIDQSLLAPSVPNRDGPRFQMLRTVNRAVHRSSDPSSISTAQEKHARWVARELLLADSALRGAREPVAARRFTELADDARVAHRWARAHDLTLAVQMTASLHLFAHSRLWAEPAQWARSIPRWRAHGAAAAAVASQASQEAEFDESWRLAHSMLDDHEPRTRAWALEALSDVAIYRGQLKDAQALSAELVALGVRLDDARMVALGSTNRSLSLSYDERPIEALQLLDDYPGPGPPSDAPTDLAWLQFCRGEALVGIGRIHESQFHYGEAMRLATEAGSPFVAGVGESGLAAAQTRLGEFAAASLTYRHHLETFRRHGITTHLTIALRNVISLLTALGAAEAAATLAGWAVSANTQPPYGPGLTDMDALRAELRTANGPSVVREWEQRGADLTIAEATTVALSAFDRYQPP